MTMKNTLLENFYTEISSDFNPGNTAAFKCEIRLNPEHAIYKGHFPQVPVVPGVCLVQIVKEILMEKTGRELVLASGDNIKFLAMINPRETPVLELAFTLKSSEKGFDAGATFSHNGTSYTKFKGSFAFL